MKYVSRVDSPRGTPTVAYDAVVAVAIDPAGHGRGSQIEDVLPVLSA